VATGSGGSGRPSGWHVVKWLSVGRGCVTENVVC
jgi:hypothetical protein